MNQDGLGNLRGYAWGVNIGWIAFETKGAPKVDLYSGKLSGYIWSANCGWISLSNAVAYVQTDTIAAGADSDHNGLSDAWEMQNFEHLGVDPNADADHDGMSNLQEYLAGTNPNDVADYLRIIEIRRGVVGDPNYTMLFWTSKSTRFYAIQYRASLDAGSVLSDCVVFPWAGVNNAAFDDSAGQEFYRIRAFRLLAP